MTGREREREARETKESMMGSFVRINLYVESLYRCVRDFQVYICVCGREVCLLIFPARVDES